MEKPIKFELVVKAIGLAISKDFLLRAHRVIE